MSKIKKKIKKPEHPVMVLTPAKMYGHLAATGLLKIDKKTWADIVAEDDFPIVDGKINLVELLAWLSMQNQVGIGEKIDWQA